MAGKISLGILVSFLLVGFGYALCRERYKNQVEKEKEQYKVLPFKVVQIAKESEPERATLSGLKSPFTVLVHETRVNMNLPGEIGAVGDIIFLPDPRQSSASTIDP